MVILYTRIYEIVKSDNVEAIQEHSFRQLYIEKAKRTGSILRWLNYDFK